MTKFPHPLPEEGLTIPLRASFLVFKRFPLLGVATNNATPLLILCRDGVEYRVIARHRRRYDEIECVDALQTFATQNIILHWRAGWFAFSGNLGDERPLASLLRFFHERGVPLSQRASQLLSKHSAA